MARIKKKKVDEDFEKRRKEKVKKYTASIPNLYQRVYERAASGLGSPRSAIKAHCLYCVGFEMVKDRIRNCKVMECPLIPFRPYQLVDDSQVDGNEEPGGDI